VRELPHLFFVRPDQKVAPSSLVRTDGKKRSLFFFVVVSRPRARAREAAGISTVFSSSGEMRARFFFPLGIFPPLSFKPEILTKDAFSLFPSSRQCLVSSVR